MARDETYYLRLSETVGDKELRGYYRDKAAEVRKSAVIPEIETLTRQYLAKLRQLGVKLPEKVSVEVKEAS